jgi:hypothetical protein
LTDPGVTAVIAIGHDGSLYAASIEVRGPISIVKFVRSAETEVRRQSANLGGIDEKVFLSQFEHLVSLVLGEAGVIRYRSVLVGARRNSFNQFREEFSRIIDEARQRVAASMMRRARP